MLETAPESRPGAWAVAALARKRWLAGHWEKADELVPRYVRRAEAEVTRTAQRFE